MTGRALLASMAATALSAVVVACSGPSATSSSDAASACMLVDPPTTCPTPPPSYHGEIKVVVATYCAQANCHAKGGAESVHDFTTYEGVYSVHLTVADELSTCLMPPPGSLQPTAAQRLSLITWADTCRAPNN